VTQDKYEKSLNFNEKDNHDQIDIQSSQYKILSYLLQDELHKKYDLRPRQNANKANEQNHHNKVITKDKSKEAYASNKKIDHPSAKRIECEHREL